MSPPSIENGISFVIECSLSGLKSKTPNCATFPQRLLERGYKSRTLGTRRTYNLSEMGSVL
jgi:hypothetical protein